MNREVHIYIEGETFNDYSKIDLFHDEQINVSSSIQNIQDLSKVYTDFSQSFTVPATANNNAIFEYFYENDIDNAIDHNLRRYAYIEIGLTPFRSGKIQLEGSSIKDGKAEHYTITFYGDLVSLKDTFGNLKISDLDYSAISNPYNASAVKSRLTDTTTDYDVRYPLISSSKLWSYGDFSNTDIKNSNGRLVWNELFPAIKVSKIFDAIETKFGLTFNSKFLQTELFKKLFLWCKNTDNQDSKMNGYDMTIDSYGNYGVNFIYNSSDNSFRLVGDHFGYMQNRVVVTILKSLTSTDIFYVDVYENGKIVSTTKFDNYNNQLEVFSCSATGWYDRKITLKIRSEQNVSIKYDITVSRINKFNYDAGYVIASKTTDLVMSTSSNSIYLNMPSITIADFFSGILKQFNLTCYMSGYNNYIIEPIDDWYSKGGIIDITKHVDTETISVDRLPLYKNISFNYEKSESFINRAFAEQGNREYGDTSLNYDYDGGDYKIQVPFENLNFQKFSNTNLQVGYSLTKEPDYKSYIPKPVLLYYNGAMTTSIKFYDGTTETTQTNIALFGNDLSYNNDIYSLNFAPETSTWYNKPIQNSLFANYYFGYLSNLFDSKNRLTKLSAYFPISLITSLKLNDRLVIKDKRYLINSISSELTNGKVNLELINDFREITNLSGGYKVSDLGGSVYTDVLIGNDIAEINLNSGTSGVSFSTTTFYTDGISEMTIPSNPTPKYVFTTEDGYRILTEQSLNFASEQGSNRLVDINFVQTKKDGTTETYTQNIIQE